MDDRLRRILAVKFNGLMNRRWEDLQSRISEIRSRSVQHGALQSTAHFQLVETECVKELRGGIADLWHTSRDVFAATQTSVTADLAKEILEDLDVRTKDRVDKLSSLLEITPGHELMRPQYRTSLVDAAADAIAEITADIELYASTAQQVQKSPNVFLSHAAGDSEIALVVKKEIENRIQGVKIFCSSDPTDLPPGVKWSPSIQAALQRAAVLILLATPKALQRPWVWFECGTFWFNKEQPIIPLCLGGVRKGKLPSPLSELQALNGDDPKDLESLLKFIAQQTSLSINDQANLDGLAEHLRSLAARTEVVAAKESGWLGAEWNGRFLAYDGPYEGLNRIEDTSFEPSMQHVLEQAGYQVVMIRAETVSARSGGYRIVQLTDRKSWRRKVSNGDVVLAARSLDAVRSEATRDVAPVIAEDDFDPLAS